MAMILSNQTRTDNRTVNKQVEISTASFTNFIDDWTDPGEPELTDEDLISELTEANEGTDDDSETYGSSESFSIQPLWILYYTGGRYYGQLHIMASIQRQKNISDEDGELLLGLQGFFAKDENSKGSWLDYLKNSGIVYFDEAAKKYEIISLGNFRAGKGQGKILPVKIESLWLEREFSNSEGKFDSKALIESLKKFCKDLQELCSTFDSQEDGYSDSDSSSKSKEAKSERKRGIGLKKIKFEYKPDVLERKKLDAWKKIWKLWSVKK